MANISTQHVRVATWVTFPIFIGNKGGERNGGKLNLFVGQFPELRNDKLLGASKFVEIRVICRLIPLEETAVIYEVFHQKILAARSGGHSVFDTIQGGYRGTNDVQHAESRLLSLH